VPKLRQSPENRVLPNAERQRLVVSVDPHGDPKILLGALAAQQVTAMDTSVERLWKENFEDMGPAIGPQVGGGDLSGCAAIRSRPADDGAHRFLPIGEGLAALWIEGNTSHDKLVSLASHHENQVGASNFSIIFDLPRQGGQGPHQVLAASIDTIYVRVNKECANNSQTFPGGGARLDHSVGDGELLGGCALKGKKNPQSSENRDDREANDAEFRFHFLSLSGHVSPNSCPTPSPAQRFVGVAPIEPAQETHEKKR